MASEAGICNIALQLIKHSKTITSLEQGTKEANACEVVFTELRDTILETSNWNWATQRVKLAQLTTTPAFGWDYSYQLPGDFLRVVSAHNNSSGFDRVPFKIEKGTLSSDASDLYLRYVARVTDPNLMPATFRSAFAKLLASRLSVALSGNAKLSVILHDQYINEDLPTAKSVDSIQDFADQLPESEWVSVRSGQRTDYKPGEPPA